jgi:hypothetical protein
MNVQNCAVFAGTDVTLTFYARDEANLPKDLTNRVVDWRVGFPPHNLRSKKAVIEKTATIDDGIIVFVNNSSDALQFGDLDFVNDVGGAGAVAGVYSVRLLPSDTAGLPGGDYTYVASTDDGILNFINNSNGNLQFINADGEDLDFLNDGGGIEVVTTGRFRNRVTIR